MQVSGCGFASVCSDLPWQRSRYKGLVEQPSPSETEKLSVLFPDAVRVLLRCHSHIAVENADEGVAG